MKEPISYGLVGAGGFGRQHVATLLELMQKGRLHLAAVCEPNIHGLPEVEAELKTHGVRVHPSLETMLAGEENLQAVTIATPIPLHEEMVRICLDRGLFIFLEKPPVPLFSQLDNMLAADRHNRVAVCFQLVEAEWSRMLKRQIAEGFLGELREIRVGACWPRADWYDHRAAWSGRLVLDGKPVFDGPATNALSHLIHQSMYLAAERPGDFAVPVGVQGELYRARPLEAYDTACLRGRFASGAAFTAAFSHARNEVLPYQIHAIGTRGWVKISEDRENMETHQGPVAIPPSNAFTRAYEAFLDYVAGVAPRPSTRLQDARGYLLATNGMLLSSGKIHDVGGQWAHRHEESGQYAIEGLDEGIAASVRDGSLFSDMDFPWAVRTPEVVEPDLSRKIGAEELLSFA